MGASTAAGATAFEAACAVAGSGGRGRERCGRCQVRGLGEPMGDTGGGGASEAAAGVGGRGERGGMCAGAEPAEEPEEPDWITDMDKAAVGRGEMERIGTATRGE